MKKLFKALSLVLIITVLSTFFASVQVHGAERGHISKGSIENTNVIEVYKEIDR